MDLENWAIMLVSVFGTGLIGYLLHKRSMDHERKRLGELKFEERNRDFRLALVGLLEPATKLRVLDMDASPEVVRQTTSGVEHALHAIAAALPPRVPADLEDNLNWATRTAARLHSDEVPHYKRTFFGSLMNAAGSTGSPGEFAGYLYATREAFKPVGH